MNPTHSSDVTPLGTERWIFPRYPMKSRPARPDPVAYPTEPSSRIRCQLGSLVIWVTAGLDHIPWLCACRGGFGWRRKVRGACLPNSMPRPRQLPLRVCDRVQSVELLAKLRKPFQNMQHSSLDFAERHALVEFGGRAVTSIQLDFLAITRHRLISLPTTI